MNCWSGSNSSNHSNNSSNPSNNKPIQTKKMAHFDQDFIDFFRELAKNNNREWFNDNKKRYEKSVKKPFAAFVAEMIGRIQQKDQEVQVQPKDCILRINRDIRFSKDKTPYNLHLTAIISPAGRKDKSIPGFFFRFGPEQIDIMGGCYGPSKEQLAALRGAIAENGAAFKKVIGAKAFVGKIWRNQGRRTQAATQRMAGPLRKNNR